MVQTRVRVDIQILRAVAVLSVIAGHFGPEYFPGGFAGVDVFFVISGFLITSLIVAEIDRTGRLSLVRFWARRIRRILPAAFVVIATTATAVLMIGSPDQIRILGRHVIASSLSAENLLLAWDAADYDRRDDSTSPLQHFWSLAVEEQFYLVWPLIVGLVLAFVTLSRRFRWDFRQSLTAVIVGVTGASFVYALSLDAAGPASYFDPFARAWELGVGATLAVWGGTLLGAARRSVRTAAAAVSWAAIVGVVFVPQLNEATPGLGVLPSVIATAAVIALKFPTPDFRTAIPRASVTSLTWIGDRSYSLYLWHWPFLILTPLALESDVDLTLTIAILLAVCVASMLSFRFVEQPFRSSDASVIRQPRFLFPVALISTLALIGTTLVLAPEARPTIPSSTIDELLPGFTEGSDDATNADYPFVTAFCTGAGASVFDCPPTNTIDFDEYSLPRGPGESAECEYLSHRDIQDCVLGNPESTRSIALVGDSHARGYWAAFDALGQRVDAAVHFFVTNACPYAITSDASCTARNDDVRKRMLSGEFEIVAFAQTQVREGEVDKDAKPLGFKESYRELLDRGVSFVVMKDNPRLGDEAYECLERKFRNPTSCSVSREEAFVSGDLAFEVATELGVPTIDLTDLYCDDKSCPAAIGGVVVYRDKGHITTVFGESLAPFLYNALRVLRFLPFAQSE